MAKEKNVPISTVIMKLLKKSSERLSTYEIAKQAGISWSTANTHCYRLKDEKKINGSLEAAAVGSGKKMMWWAR